MPFTSEHRAVPTPRLESLEPRRLLAATPAWAFPLGEAGADAIADVVTDHSGNVYVAGMFRGTVDFNPRRTRETVLRAAAVVPSGFIAKFSPDGVLRWALPLDLTGDDALGRGALEAVAVDRAGGVYLSGHFAGTVDFDPSRFAAETITTTAEDAFVAKLDADGDLVWARQIDSTRDIPIGAFAPALAFGLNDDLFISGEMRSSGDELDGSPYLARLNRLTGAVLFVRDLLPDLPDLPSRGQALATDRAGNVVVAGAYGSSGESFGTEYTRTGSPTWAAQFAGGSRAGATGLALDNRGSVFVAGTVGRANLTVNRFDMDPGQNVVELATAESDAYAARLTADGEFVWARKLGGAGSDVAGDLRLDPTGHVVVGGTFLGVADFDPRRGQFLLDAGTARDVFVATLTPTGNFVGALAIGGRRPDVRPEARLWIDRAGSLVVGGTFSRAIDADPGEGELTLFSNEASDDAFVVKLRPERTGGWSQAPVAQ